MVFHKCLFFVRIRTKGTNRTNGTDSDSGPNPADEFDALALHYVWCHNTPSNSVQLAFDGEKNSRSASPRTLREAILARPDDPSRRFTGETTGSFIFVSTSGWGGIAA